MIRKAIILCLMAVLLGAPAVFAEDENTQEKTSSSFDSLKSKSSKSSFFGNLSGKVKNIAPRKKTAVTTAVGGVRGAKEDTEVVYWKGKEKEIIVAEDELNDFNAALDLAVAGDNAKSIAEFERFLATYPESALRHDAIEAIDNLKADNGGN